MSIEEHEALVRRLYTAFLDQGQMDIADQLLAPDVVLHPSIPAQGTVSGREAVKQTFQEFLAEFGSRQTTVDDLVAAGDRVVARRTHQLTRPSAVPALALGKSLSLPGVDIFHFADGQVAEWWKFDSILGVLPELDLLRDFIHPGAATNQDQEPLIYQPARTGAFTASLLQAAHNILHSLHGEPAAYRGKFTTTDDPQQVIAWYIEKLQLHTGDEEMQGGRFDGSWYHEGRADPEGSPSTEVVGVVHDYAVINGDAAHPPPVTVWSATCKQSTDGVEDYTLTVLVTRARDETTTQIALSLLAAPQHPPQQHTWFSGSFQHSWFNGRSQHDDC